MDHKEFEINEKGRDFVLSDLHGCYTLLIDKMKEVSFNPKVDRIFSVGDIIDRGPESLKCLSLIRERWFNCVRGNHEDMMIKVILQNDYPSYWVQGGGGWYLIADRYELEQLCILADALPYSITVKTSKGNIGICHAEPAGYKWSISKKPTERDKYDMIWSRILINDTAEYIIEGVNETYHGHSPVKSPIKKGNINFIDTGAFYTDVLTLLQIN